MIIFAGVRDLAGYHGEIEQSFVELLSYLLGVPAGDVVVQPGIRSLEPADLPCEVSDLI